MLLMASTDRLFSCLFNNLENKRKQIVSLQNHSYMLRSLITEYTTKMGISIILQKDSPMSKIRVVCRAPHSEDLAVQGWYLQNVTQHISVSSFSILQISQIRKLLASNKHVYELECDKGDSLDGCDYGDGGSEWH